MASGWRALRGKVLTPSRSEANLEVRGFHVKSPAARQMLETIGETFLTGYEYAAEAKVPAEVDNRLEELPEELRGFAYEGAGMGFAIRDALPLGGSNLGRFLEGKASNHVYMVNVGVGWALARLPRFRWAKASAGAQDPVLRWLVLDGYGFHQAYFHTDKYLKEQYREPNFPWPASVPAERADSATYANRVIDQGIGRATWFVAGADPGRAADLIDAFSETRRADLYAGAGLAATYAGAVDEGELHAFMKRAGRYQPQVAQGAVFAAAARYQTGLMTHHTELAAGLLAGVTPKEASELADRTRDQPFDTFGAPAYEQWRQRIYSQVGQIRWTVP